MGFELQTVLAAQGCSSYSWAALTKDQDPSASHPTPAVTGLGVHKGTQLSPGDPGYILYNMTSCSYLFWSCFVKMFGVLLFIVPNSNDVMELYFPGDRWTPACTWEVWINSLLHLAFLGSGAFVLPIKLSASHHMGFHTLIFPEFSLCSQGRRVSERLCGAELLTQVKPQEEYEYFYGDMHYFCFFLFF